MKCFYMHTYHTLLTMHYDPILTLFVPSWLNVIVVGLFCARVAYLNFTEYDSVLPCMLFWLLTSLTFTSFILTTCLLPSVSSFLSLCMPWGFLKALKYAIWLGIQFEYAIRSCGLGNGFFLPSHAWDHHMANVGSLLMLLIASLYGPTKSLWYPKGIHTLLLWLSYLVLSFWLSVLTCLVASFWSHRGLLWGHRGHLRVIGGLF